uniref:(northern house mosquito) hypothetical protein n=1 Tax=Culex pipiens TaxID=7175 RepID=A0A8D8B767_CULPI
MSILFSRPVRRTSILCSPPALPSPVPSIQSIRPSTPASRVAFPARPPRHYCSWRTELRPAGEVVVFDSSAGGPDSGVAVVTAAASVVALAGPVELPVAAGPAARSSFRRDLEPVVGRVAAGLGRVRNLPAVEEPAS